uniref:Uncharacterized protein n=1 Tax=Arundo donax TaxID=35708 RepID=A0A0A9CEZ4_ARUDO
MYHILLHMLHKRYLFSDFQR